jgi:hypothetical protein
MDVFGKDVIANTWSIHPEKSFRSRCPPSTSSGTRVSPV